MPYSHLTYEERFSIAALLKSGVSAAEVSKVLGRHRSTIYREIKRNCSPVRGWYHPGKAHQRSQARKRWVRKRPKRDDLRLRQRVKRGIKLGWSPEQIAGRLRHEYEAAPWEWVSHQTIYTMVREDLGLPRMLRQGCKKQRKRYGTGKDRRGMLSGCTSISQRPPVVDQRGRLGDWEGDTMSGGKSKAVVGGFVERKTGFFLACTMADRSSESMLAAAKKVYSSLPGQVLHTLTLDNGKENACHGQIKKEIGLEVYFADPGCAWQKGAIENIFGLLRQYIPKKADISKVDQKEMDKYVAALNNRPRKRLGFRTPYEAFKDLLVALDS